MTIQPKEEAFGQLSPAIGVLRHDIATLDLERLSKRFVTFTPSGQTIAELVAMGARDIGAVASPETVAKAVSHNPDTLWAVTRRSRFNAAHPIAEGFYAFLMLNAEGMKRLGEGTFNGADPDLSLLAAQNEKPAGIYAWAVCASRGLTGALPLVMQKFATPLYKDVDMFTKAATDAGARFFEALGFKQGALIHGHFLPKLLWLDRSGSDVRSRPLYDSYRASPPAHRIGVGVVRTIDDLLRVFAVRSAVYMAEQSCPYEEEFDGNDFCATHLIGYVGDEPAGCIRVRCFADFAKVERVAIRPEFRKSRLAHRLVRAAIALCQAKGYRRLYGQPRTDLLRFYSHFGFERFEGAKTLWFSGVEYCEVVLELDQPQAAIRIGVDPYVLIRPEGRWQLPGILERSAGRRFHASAGTQRSHSPLPRPTHVEDSSREAFRGGQR